MRKIVTILCLICSITSLQSQSISGKAGKIWYSENMLYVNLVNKGVMVINNKNPKRPKNLGFIEIPGNIDIAVRDKVLFANNHDDLIAIDISQPRKINNSKVLKRFNNIFPALGNSRGKKRIKWLKPPEKRWVASSAGVVSSSKGGSMACFALANNHLYTINGRQIHSFNVRNPKEPKKSGRPVKIRGDHIETVFCNNNNLFIGAQKGMYIFSLANPNNPTHIGTYQHAESCDPVVVEGRYAYLTLRDGTECNHRVNRLEIVDISNPSNPRRVSSTRMTHPHGLAVDNQMVFLCDGRAGLKVVNASNPRRVRTVQQLREVTNTYDVMTIPSKNLLIMVGDKEVIQYDYSRANKLKKISKFEVGQ